MLEAGKAKFFSTFASILAREPLLLEGRQKGVENSQRLCGLKLDLSLCHKLLFYFVYGGDFGFMCFSRGANVFCSIVRARCSRTFTFEMLIVRASAVSMMLNSSTSRNRNTSR